MPQPLEPTLISGVINLSTRSDFNPARFSPGVRFTPAGREDQIFLSHGFIYLLLLKFILSQEPWEGALYLPLDRTSPAERTPISLRAIPYYAWGNRGLRSMRVWVPFSTDARG